MTGFEIDLTHFNQYRDTRTIDPNLFYNPATGYNQNPAAVNGLANRPNRAYTQIAYFVSTGHRDQTQLSMALNRRFKNNFQSGITYTYMVSMHDDGNIGYTAPGQNNQFDYLDGEYATSTDYQKNTLRLFGLYRFPLGISASVSYFYGSGNRFAAAIAAAVYGKPGTNRLNLTAAGGADQRHRRPGNGDARQRRRHRHRQPVPRTVDDQFRRHDSAQRAAGAAAAQGGSALDQGHQAGRQREDLADRRGLQPVQPPQLRQLQRQSERDRAPATTALFGQPQQNTGNAYVPRQAQFAFRLGF